MHKHLLNHDFIWLKLLHQLTNTIKYLQQAMAQISINGLHAATIYIMEVLACFPYDAVTSDTRPRVNTQNNHALVHCAFYTPLAHHQDLLTNQSVLSRLVL